MHESEPRNDAVQGIFVGGPLDKETFSLPSRGPVDAALLVVVIGQQFHHYEMSPDDPTVSVPVFAYRGQRSAKLDD